MLAIASYLRGWYQVGRSNHVHKLLLDILFPVTLASPYYQAPRSTICHYYSSNELFKIRIPLEVEGQSVFSIQCPQDLHGTFKHRFFSKNSSSNHPLWDGF